MSDLGLSVYLPSLTDCGRLLPLSRMSSKAVSALSYSSREGASDLTKVNPRRKIRNIIFGSSY